MPTAGGSCPAHHPPQINEEGLGRQHVVGRCPFLSLHTHTTVPVPTLQPVHWGNMSHNMQLGPVLVTTGTRHAAKGPAFGACSEPTRGKAEDTLRNPNIPNRLKQGSEDG